METNRSLLSNVKDIYLESRKSAKTGNSYDALVIEFKDGYKKVEPVFGDTAYVLGRQTKGN